MIGRSAIDLSRPSLRVLFLLLAMLDGAACQRVVEDSLSQLRNIPFLHYFSFSVTFTGTMDTSRVTSLSSTLMSF